MTWREHHPKLTTRLRGLPPILSCEFASNPEYANAECVLDPKTGLVLGWLKPWSRFLGLSMVIACRHGLVRLVGTVRTREADTDAVTRYLVDYHAQLDASSGQDW